MSADRGLDVFDPLEKVLLAELGDILLPPTMRDEPSSEEFTAMQAAVAAHFAGRDTPGVTRLRCRRMRPGPVGSVWRVGAAAVVVVTLSASAAAAAGGGMPLPRPMRAVAYAVGLPVDSPALDDTHRHLRALDEAVDQGDRPEARRTVLRLEKAVARVPADERHDVENDVAAALAAAAPLLGERHLETDGAKDPASAPTASAPTPRPSSATATDIESRARPTTPTTARPYPSAVATEAEGSATASADAPGSEAATDSAAPSDGDGPSDDRSASSPSVSDPDSDPTQGDQPDPSSAEEQAPPVDNPDDAGDTRTP